LVENELEADFVIAVTDPDYLADFVVSLTDYAYSAGT